MTKIKKLNTKTGKIIEVDVKPKPVSKRVSSFNAKFWDNDKQKHAAKYYIKKNGLDGSDPKVREKVRDIIRLRFKDEKKVKTEKKIKKPIEKHSNETVTTIKTEQFVTDVLSEGLEQALRSGPLPPPTGYNSVDGTWWDNPTDIINRKRVNYYINENGKKQPLPKFGTNDILWIEFFLGDPITGGTLLRPKKKADIIELKAKNLLGKIFPIQEEMSLYLDENPWAKFEVWRGAGKTVIVLGKLLRKICDNPNECFFLQSETDDKTIQRIRALKRELQTNQKIISFYGYLPADSASTGNKKKDLGKTYKGKWSEGLLELKREYTGIEPTLMGISWNTGRGVGYHFTGGVLDDPWSGHSQNREGDFKKFWDWWGEFYGSLEYADFCWVLCTKKAQDDIYTKMDNDKLFATFRRNLVLEMPLNVKLIEKNGAYIGATIVDKDPNIKYVYDDCFGKYTIEKALLIRQRIGIEMFEREYQNNPRRLQGKLLNWDRVRICTPNSTDRYAQMPFHSESLRKLRGIMMYDPAFGLSESASYNALVAMAEYDKRIYILKIWMGHWAKDERVRAFQDARSQFPRFPFYCEDVMHQLNVIKDLTDSTGIFLRPFSPKGKGIKYQDLFKGQNNSSKKAKIYDGFEPIIEDERLYVVESTPYFSEFEDEFKNFPDSLKLDVIDAASMGCMILDQRKTTEAALDSGYVERDPFLPQNAFVGNVFQIGRR